MDSVFYPVNPYSPDQLSGYFDAFVHNMSGINNPGDWNSTWVQLMDQKHYLQELLSKTAVTLNALRERQNRNERALNNCPTPRSRKKKILQSRWRTDKTIKTCENEERVIYDCLQVCQSNISTLEGIVNTRGTSSTVPDFTSTQSSISYDTPLTSEFNWNGWADEEGESPFHKPAQACGVVDEIPPEMTIKDVQVRHLPPLAPLEPLPPRVHTDLPPVPPNTARPSNKSSETTLSPEAASSSPALCSSSARRIRPRHSTSSRFLVCLHPEACTGFQSGGSQMMP